MRKYSSRVWRYDGSIEQDAPRWAKLRADMQPAFPTYYATDNDPFAELVGQAIRQLNQLKPEAIGHGYLGYDPNLDYSQVADAELAPNMDNVENVIYQSIALFEGMPNWNHPRVMPNVIPPANTAAIIAAMMTNVFSPNIIEGEYAWNVEKSEMESAAIIAKLIGWDAREAGGLYTFGGSGCYFYGLKYALTQVLPDSRCKGIRTDGKLLVSQQGHYCMMNSTDWTGLGMENIITIKTDPQTNAMDMEDLERVMQELSAERIPIISIVCTMGTTDAFAIDPVDQVRELIDKYPNPPGFGRTFLYCDAVIGWSWLTFKDYDFMGNPLGFDDIILSKIERNYRLISKVIYADAIGCDFHKTGWSTYNCSIFMMRDLAHFKTLMLRPGSVYLQERTCYNPGLYTLEVSRSGSYSMAGWATLKFLGQEGFQSLLGGILEMGQYLRDCIDSEDTSVCVNDEDYGFVTLFRVYRRGVNAREQYNRELNEPNARNELIENNKFQQKIADQLWEWFRTDQQLGAEYAPYISYTSGFRPTSYNMDQSDPEAVIYALKSYPMNININAQAMDTLLELVLLARDAVLEGEANTETRGNCQPPYCDIDEANDLQCNQPDPKRGLMQIRSLLSGVGMPRY